VGERTVTLRRNRDGTLTVRVGRAVEHVSTEARSHGQVFDAVRYAIISKGVYLPEHEVASLLYEASSR
jgi:hypothetical protein